MTKRTNIQREKDLPLITDLYLRGRTQMEIAAELGLSQGTISNDIQEIQRRWREDTAINLDEAKSTELAKIDLMERDYQEWKLIFLAAWESSKIERTKSRQETDGTVNKDKKPNVRKMSMEREQRDGNPAFLDGLLKCNAGIDGCIDRRCKLLGLYMPMKQELAGPNGGPIKMENTSKPDLSKLSLDELLNLRQMMSKATDDPAKSQGH